MRLVFMGTPDFAAFSLKALAASDHEVLAVVTQPDKPRGRGQKLKASAVKAAAEDAAALPVLQPAKVKEESFVAQLSALALDLIVVVAYGQKIPAEILRLPRYGCINVHASLLPRWRGAAPIQAAIYAGDRKTGVSIMYLDEGWDTGDIILKREVEIAPRETGGSLHDKLASLGADCLLEAIDLIAQGAAPRTPQTQEGACYAPKLEENLFVIDWRQEAAKIERLIRALNPFPGARTYHQGRLLRLWSGKVTPGAGARPGTILSLSQAGIVVQAKDEALRIEEIQRSGGTRMSAGAFICGYTLHRGEILG
jgi:methionyl-tRNA formyltransferase